MARSIGVKIKVVKASTSKRNGKPLTGDKSIVLEPAILLYEIEDSDNTEEGEE